jgi:RimJ/RimL family protein N-acetyltransferase/nitrite reductase/ring-hydroxylating ferredoxin subunit
MPPINPPNPPLTDGVVTLRPFRASDAQAIYLACQDPEISRWVPLIPSPYQENDARGFVLMTLEAWHEGTSCEFAIVDESDGLLGAISLHLDANPRRHAVGYWVAAEARGRGVATRAVRLVSRWAFGTMGTERLALWTLPGNVASGAVAEACGFQYEGLTRAWDRGRDGEPADVVMYSLTAEDLTTTATPGGGQELPAIAATPRELRARATHAAPFVELGPVADLTPGSMKRVTIADLDLLVAWTPAGIVVTDDRCPHMAAPLSAGRLDGCEVACPLHEGRFDLLTGETVQMPTTGGLDADGEYHESWSPSGAATPRPEPASKKLEARRLTRVNRLRYYPARIRDGVLEAQVPLAPE